MTALDDAAAALTAERDALRARADRIDEVLAMISGLGVEPEAASPPAAATPVASTPRPDTPTRKAKKATGAGGPLACDVDGCDRTFAHAQALGTHKAKTHGIYSTERAAKRQRKSSASNDDAPATDDDPAESWPPAKAAAGHTCEVCGTTFLTRGSLASHRHREDHYLEDEPA